MLKIIPRVFDKSDKGNRIYELYTKEVKIENNAG